MTKLCCYFLCSPCMLCC